MVESSAHPVYDMGAIAFIVHAAKLPGIGIEVEDQVFVEGIEEDLSAFLVHPISLPFVGQDDEGVLDGGGRQGDGDVVAVDDIGRRPSEEHLGIGVVVADVVVHHVDAAKRGIAHAGVAVVVVQA